MRIKEKLTIFCLFLAISVLVSAQTEKCKVACVGNSITYGSRIEDRENNNYPVVLGRLLGDQYEVRNFGIGGRTMLNKGDRPYMKEQIYQDMLEFLPNIVVIKLGTNDSKAHNWIHQEEFPKDMQQMIDELRKLSSNPHIYLCYPAKSYLLSGESINDSIIVNGVMPYIDYVAERNKLEIIDLHSVTDGMEQNFPDKIHPNGEGAVVIANAVYKVISSSLD